jgi:hypothetical protein
MQTTSRSTALAAQARKRSENLARRAALFREPDLIASITFPISIAQPHDLSAISRTVR